MAEIRVPACPIPTQKTKLVMSHAQPTGTLRPQMPIPSQKSHDTATPSRPSSATAGRKKNHQPSGVGFSIGSTTASVIARNVGDRRMSSGRRSTGLSRTAASASGGKDVLEKDGGIYHPRRVSVKGA